ncbi:MAG: hypothetical protein PHU94_05255 [Bacilli bacterium]|nr:hypothetical protein [Bacilli bacterium]MDD4734371.1 hypothetical protein [Bacilli bacterium]
MRVLNKNELIDIKGGINLTGTLISSIIKGVNTFLDLGRSLGSSLRRSFSGKTCPA